MNICISENEDIKKVVINGLELTSKMTTGEWTKVVTNVKITSKNKQIIVASVLLLLIEQ